MSRTSTDGATKPLSKKLKAAWIAALRSGRYKQARKSLIGDARNSYCCLGVLSRVMHPKKRRDDLPYPSRDVLSQAEQFVLAEMNDGVNGRSQHDFKQIANFIKANL